MSSKLLTEEKCDIQRLFSFAIKAANSQTDDGVDGCLDILGYLMNLSFSSKDLVSLSKEISILASLRDHRNPTIRMSAKDLFNSWMRTMYSGGGIRDPSTTDLVVKVCPGLKKKKKNKFQRSVMTKKKTENQRFKVHQVCENNLNDRKPLATKKPIEEKKQHAVPMKLSVEIKQQKSVPQNSTETLELFEIAKKSADVASAKGTLLSIEETSSICVDTLSLLIDYPISSTPPETKRIMERLWYLTKHKDRKICNSATALLQHWRQSITDQQQGN